MNAITRGGIEFIAVLFGLSISLWIDNNAKENELKVQNKKILNRLYHNLQADSTDGVWNFKAYERAIRGSENVIKWCDSNPTFSSIDDSIEKDISAMMIATIFVHNEEEYIALKNSGRTDLITNEDLVIKLHDYYTRIGFIKTLDAFQNDFVRTQIAPYLSDFADENLYNKEDKNSIVYENFPKVSLYRMPDVKKMRFYASNMLTWQRYTQSWYKGQVRRVTEIRKLLREELDFKTTLVNNS
ncbi:MAG: hypothetical protein VX924_00595 [Candidatus Neomarinimicrobiota bacterium]|nr:hypothetical protein [Candidatus Neomarinimicrobiota bacterium]|tara:strand:+ start:1197 stop:1922 length:726 start_codon:yes stop_codon:yes gene_type:complete